jgi:hypothetical protein
MVDKSRKKEIARAWRERTPDAGVFAVRCQASVEVWVGWTPGLEAQKNALWFMLRMGNHPNPAVQAAWQAHGESAFTYEVLERVDAGELTPGGLADALKARDADWRARLGAAKVAG